MGRLDRPLRKVAQTVLAKFGTDVTVAGQVFDIVRVENVMGTDENVYYVLQLRR
jgi:hypothetical protein